MRNEYDNLIFFLQQFLYEPVTKILNRPKTIIVIALSYLLPARIKN